MIWRRRRPRMTVGEYIAGMVDELVATTGVERDMAGTLLIETYPEAPSYLDRGFIMRRATERVYDLRARFEDIVNPPAKEVTK